MTTVDLEKAPIAEVMAALDAVPATGLSAEEGRKRLAQYGPNALVEKQKSLAQKLVGCFTGPIARTTLAGCSCWAACGWRPSGWAEGEPGWTTRSISLSSPASGSS